MSYATYERHRSVGIVTLNRPERLNAISGALLADFEAALVEGFADEEVSAVVLTGAGRAFCAGDDLKEFDLQTRDLSSVQSHVRAIQQITRILMGSERPVIGAVHGYAVGGGFEWLLNCDLVVAADDLVAFLPEMDWGQFVTGGLTHLLPLAVGYQRAMELILLGERQEASRLREWGLVNRVVPRERMLAEAIEIAEKVGRKSHFSIGRLKRLINQDLSVALWRALELEESITIQAFQRPEAAERVMRFAGQKEE